MWLGVGGAVRRWGHPGPVGGRRPFDGRVRVRAAMATMEEQYQAWLRWSGRDDTADAVLAFVQHHELLAFQATTQGTAEAGRRRRWRRRSEASGPARPGSGDGGAPDSIGVVR